MPDALPIFEQVAQDNKIVISTASDPDIALLCKLTFESVETLLDLDLDILPEQNVYDAKDALNRIYREYRAMMKKSTEKKTAEDVKKIMPKLEEAVIQINAAAKILKDTVDDKNERRESIQLYSRAIIKCYDQVEEINAILK